MTFAHDALELCWFFDVYVFQVQPRGTSGEMSYSLTLSRGGLFDAFDHFLSEPPSPP